MGTRTYPRQTPHEGSTTDEPPVSLQMWNALVILVQEVWKWLRETADVDEQARQAVQGS